MRSNAVIPNHVQIKAHGIWLSAASGVGWATEYTARRRSPHAAGAQWRCNTTICLRPRCMHSAITSNDCRSSTTTGASCTTISPTPCCHSQRCPSQRKCPCGIRCSACQPTTAHPTNSAADIPIRNHRAAPRPAPCHHHSANTSAVPPINAHHTHCTTRDACTG